MASCLDKIDLGLLIERPNIVLPWNASKNEILGLDKEFQKIVENYYTLKVSLQNFSFMDSLGLYFENNKLSKIELYNGHKSDEGNLQDEFYDHQKIFEQCIGKPSKQLAITKIFTRVNKDDREYKWYFKYVTITHKIWDRFGLEEKMIISIKK